MGLRILQFGRSGQVGLELLLRAVRRGHQVSALGRELIDFAQPSRVPRALSVAGPVDVVINGAAYTGVDKAEVEPELANRVNGESVGVLAETCAKKGLPLLHLSTDYVFDGGKPGPYAETDPTGPLNAYGRSKLLGETLLRERWERHIILRNSWIYSAHGRNFLKTMLGLGAERDTVEVVDDQLGAPTSAGDIAEACLTICERIAAGGDPVWGTYHYAAAGETSWCGFARAIFEMSSSWAGTKARVIPVASSDYPTAARRPRNSRLDCGKIDRVFGVRRRPWREALGEVLSEVRSAKEAATR